jgi:hypothetical protein
VALALFTIRAVGALAGPFAVLAGLLVFAPAAFGAHLMVFLLVCSGFGLLFCLPRKINLMEVVLRVAYVGAMVVALLWWLFFGGIGYFPDAVRYIRFDV